MSAIVTVKILPNMPAELLKKYNLQVGEEYNSVQAFYMYCNISQGLTYVWKKLGYVSIIREKPKHNAKKRSINDYYERIEVGPNSINLDDCFYNSITRNINLAKDSIGTKLQLEHTYGPNGWMMLMLFYIDLIIGLYDMFIEMKDIVDIKDVMDCKEIKANTVVKCTYGRVHHYCSLFNDYNDCLNFTIKAGIILQKMLLPLMKDKNNDCQND